MASQNSGDPVAFTRAGAARIAKITQRLERGPFNLPPGRRAVPTNTFALYPAIPDGTIPGGSPFRPGKGTARMCVPTSPGEPGMSPMGDPVDVNNPEPTDVPSNALLWLIPWNNLWYLGMYICCEVAGSSSSSSSSSSSGGCNLPNCGGCCGQPMAYVFEFQSACGDATDTATYVEPNTCRWEGPLGSHIIFGEIAGAGSHNVDAGFNGVSCEFGGDGFPEWSCCGVNECTGTVSCPGNPVATLIITPVPGTSNGCH